MNEKYDYDFMETRNILCSQIRSNIEILDEKVYFETHRIVAEIYTKDEEIITLLTTANESFESIVNNVIQLNTSRVLSKKAFHKYIEDKYPNSDYSEYATLFKDYRVFIENSRNEAFKIINQNIEVAISNKELEDNPEIIKVEPYEIKGKLSSMLNESINGALELTKIFYKDKEYDYSILLNLLGDCRVVWVESIREKTGMDKISLSFKNTKKTIEIGKNKKGRYYFPALQSALIDIEDIIQNDISDEKLFIVYNLLSAFNDIEIARVLCTARYKGISIMDNRTFNKKLKHPLISDNLV